MAIGWDLKHFLSAMATSQYGNPDHRRAVTVPAPSNEEIEARLRDLITPGTFANLKTVKGSAKQLRDRVLTLPVMAAIVLSLVYRQVSGLSEVLRLLEQEGLMWAGAIKVSKQALSNRLRDIPAGLFANMFEQVVARSSQQVARLVPPGWEVVESKFAAVWLADGSTLEALVKKLPLLKEQKSPLGGRMMMMVDAWSLRPTAAWSTEDQHANDKTWCEQLLAKLPVNGLLGLAYLWVAGSNGVQIQIYASWIFYLVLIDLCSEVAVALRQPLEQISVEMVFRSLYHFSRARQLGRASEIVPFLVDNARSFGLVKAQRQRHRDIKSQSLDIWASFLS